MSGEGALGARRVLLAWLPAALYMGLIWLISSMEAPQFPTSAFPLRDKGVHFTEFAVLGFFVAHAALRTWEGRARFRLLAVSVLIAATWGLLDEIHQAFVPGRSSDVFDVLADTLGATAGASARVLLGALFARSSRPLAADRALSLEKNE